MTSLERRSQENYRVSVATQSSATDGDRSGSTIKVARRDLRRGSCRLDRRAINTADGLRVAWDVGKTESHSESYTISSNCHVHVAESRFRWRGT